MPLGCHAVRDGDLLSLTGFVASPDGAQLIRRSLCGEPTQAEKLGTQLAELLMADGAAEILAALGANPLPLPKK